MNSPLLLVAFLLLVVRPGAPSSVLAPLLPLCPFPGMDSSADVLLVHQRPALRGVWGHLTGRGFLQMPLVAWSCLKKT